MRSLLIAVGTVALAMTLPVAEAATPEQDPAFHEDAAAWRGGASPFEGVVAFGDSLSDSGNVFVATRTFEVRPFEEIPDAPYLIGGFRFSNGPTWIEWLSRALGMRDSGRPSLLAPGRFTNYAFGGARARPESPSPVSIGTEIDLFLVHFGSAPPAMLYVVWIGGNDLRDALEDPEAAAEIVTLALAATLDSIRRLHSAGARSFLVPNLLGVRSELPDRRANAEIGQREPRRSR